MQKLAYKRYDINIKRRWQMQSLYSKFILIVLWASVNIRVLEEMDAALEKWGDAQDKLSRTGYAYDGDR